MIYLTEQEAKALNEFIAENYPDFQRAAYQFLSNDEAEALCDKLEKS